MQSINPATEEVLESFEEFSPRQIDQALQQAHDGSRRWRETPLGERAARLQAMARALRSRDKAHRARTMLSARVGRSPLTGWGRAHS
jgi:acyl-CoA reductase-like NAD-dependent aldehyde dehydrogenase